MNIQYLQEILSQTEEITVIGKSTEVDGVICNVMGVVRYGRQIRLLILQYDEAFQNRVEEAEISDLCSIDNIHKSNRRLLLQDRKIDVVNPFQGVKKVFIGKSEFEVHSSENRRLSDRNWECLLLISEFLRHGWQPEGINLHSIDMLFLTSLELTGDYNEIPDFGENLILRFVMHPHTVSHLIEKPITLTVGDEYTEKLYFKDAVTGEEHWVQINRVYLLNMWIEMAKTFDDPKMLEHTTIEEIAKAKLDFEERFLEICPKDMCFPTIEYECEEGISLQFYSQTYLDAMPVSRGSSMGFIIRPDQSTGILGYRLKAAIIQEPVTSDTVNIDSELFQYDYTSTRDDIVL
jgi:hypothetical protein